MAIFIPHPTLARGHCISDRETSGRQDIVPGRKGYNFYTYMINEPIE